MQLRARKLTRQSRHFDARKSEKLQIIICFANAPGFMHIYQSKVNKLNEIIHP